MTKQRKWIYRLQNRIIYIYSQLTTQHFIRAGLRYGMPVSCCYGERRREALWLASSASRAMCVPCRPSFAYSCTVVTAREYSLWRTKEEANGQWAAPQSGLGFLQEPAERARVQKEGVYCKAANCDQLGGADSDYASCQDACWGILIWIPVMKGREEGLKP